MSQTETTAEVKAKILLDEANLAFSETSERKDTTGDRKPDGSAWEEGRMEGEYDEADYQRILELQMDAAVVCDEHPELEDETAKLFESITETNGEEVLNTVLANKNIMVNNVTIIGKTNLPSLLSADASSLYARNIFEFIKLLINDKGELHVNMEDELVSSCLIKEDKQ